MIVVAAMTTGCAGCAQRFDSKKIALDRERYGATADQRIKELAADAERAQKEGGGGSQEFTRRLAATVLEEHDP